MKKQKSIKILVKTMSKKTINGNSNFLNKVWLSVNSFVAKNYITGILE
jgi:hypothetical protein